MYMAYYLGEDSIKLFIFYRDARRQWGITSGFKLACRTPRPRRPTGRRHLGPKLQLSEFEVEFDRTFETATSELPL